MWDGVAFDEGRHKLLCGTMVKRSRAKQAPRGSANARASKPVATTRAAQRAGTREQIRLAALELFSTKGFEETTTQAIAQRAGVAAGTVFLHASDKTDLLSLVMHDRLESAMESAFATVPEGPLVEQLMSVFRVIFAMYGEHPKLGAAFVSRFPGATGPNAARVNMLTFGFLHRLGLLITGAQTRGEVARELNPPACAQNVFGLYFMALLGWLSGHYTLETALDSILRTALDLQMRGFRA